MELSYMLIENQLAVKVLVWTQYVFHLPISAFVFSSIHSTCLYTPNIVFDIPMIFALRNQSIPLQSP